MKFDKNSLERHLLLYAVTDRRWTEKSSLFEQVKLSLEGGATMVQLREKDLDYESFKNEGLLIQNLCRGCNVPFLINDNVALAREIDSDGVHIGQGDMTLVEARKILGKDRIIGVSVQTVEQAVVAEKNGADYLGVGAVFKTSSKDDALEVDFKTLKKICESVKIPVVAIGGITLQNMEKLRGSGISGVAVISAIFAESDIRLASRNLVEKSRELF